MMQGEASELLSKISTLARSGGYTRKSLAEKLGINKKTIDNAVRRILDLTGEDLLPLRGPPPAYQTLRIEGMAKANPKLPRKALAGKLGVTKNTVIGVLHREKMRRPAAPPTPPPGDLPLNFFPPPGHCLYSEPDVHIHDKAFRFCREPVSHIGSSWCPTHRRRVFVRVSMRNIVAAGMDMPGENPKADTRTAA